MLLGREEGQDTIFGMGSVRGAHEIVKIAQKDRRKQIGQ